MSILEPGELEESPLADLHALASELGIEGYRRLRREQLIAAILASQGEQRPEGGAGAETAQERSLPEPAAAAGAAKPPTGEPGAEAGAPEPPTDEPGAAQPPAGETAVEEAPQPAGPAEQGPGEQEGRRAEGPGDEEVRTGTLDILPNGSGFVRGDPFSHSPDDVYVSPAQIRRCELRTGDEIVGPVRAPRRSERYPSLVRVERVNGAAAEPPAERSAFRDLTPAFARERLAAPEGLEAAPFGKGSRVAVVGAPGAGATTLLRRLAATLSDQHPELELVVVLAGARPEELAEWRSATTVPVVGGSFDEPPDRQGEAATMAVERAKRKAERGDHAAVLVDSLEFLPPAAARRVFGAARNTEEAGSVTVIAATGLAPEPARHATTRISLAPGVGEPRVDGDASGALRADLLG
jgi:transcription termination factor Rho